MTKKPEAAAAAIAEPALPEPPREPIATRAERAAELSAEIGRDEAALADAEQRHGDAASLDIAATIEHEIATLEARVRRRRGELRRLERAQAAAERDAQEAEREPHRERLAALVRDPLPEAVARYRRALEEALAAGQALVELTREIGATADRAGHPRAAEFRLTDPDVGTSLAWTALGVVGYRLSARVLEQRKLFTASALDRLLVGLQALARDGG